MEELVKDSLSKSKLSNLWINSLKCFVVCFYCISKSTSTKKIIWNWDPNQLILPNVNIFRKTNRGLELLFTPDFLHDFWRKSDLKLHYNDIPSLIGWMLLLLEILNNMFIAVICFPVCDVIKFEINLSFFIKPFSYMTKNVRTKI